MKPNRCKKRGDNAAFTDFGLTILFKIAFGASGGHIRATHNGLGVGSNAKALENPVQNY